MDNADLANRFTYHTPVEGQPEKYKRIRDAGYAVAFTLNELCPDSREKSLAITALEETVFWANASIARNGL